MYTDIHLNGKTSWRMMSSMANAARVGKVILLLFLVRPAHSLGSCKEAGLCCTGRDASCVVQKTPQNAIIEDLRDTPCYCDHACLKLNDCCPDYRQTCGVQDCQVSEWGPWSECDNQCGSGSQERTRVIAMEPSRGGKSCPPTLQKRGCQGTSQCGTNKSTHHKAALKEMAMLLPASFGASRRMNDSHDIRKNLRFRNAELAQEHSEDSTNDYCVTFELTKVSKACHKEKVFNSLLDGGVVCVRCEHRATRDYLGGRCGGHGVPGRITRWTSLTNVECHGKWLRRPDESQEVSSSTCSCTEDALLIFV